MKNQNTKVVKPEQVQTKKISVPIVVAWIGLLTAVLVALIDLYGKRILATPNPTSTVSPAIVFTDTTVPKLIPVDTIPSSELTPTLISFTDTPVPIAIGKDWMAGCISTLWSIYPSDIPSTERGDGCWKEPLYVFSAENGDLDFLAERESGLSEIYGLFVLLPESGTVTFTIRLRELSNVDLLMGIFVEPNITSQGLLMTMLNGDVNRRAFVQKDPSNYETMQGSQAVNQSNGYSISFTFNNISAYSIVNPHVFVTNSVSMPSAQKWLFLGYKGLNGYYRIDGTFLNFELK